ncbi:hypothetical protein TNCV_3503801 [Trichonephila clavipes]|uniref:Uncharacterized protein n=1 Tax=Trichonephila clavipes TaxID=2585209 RepID=A0A8X6VCJ8_TRICX|nr:hypothetical protein TNCV_3503801 [Trichonephila clavipes]
MRSACDQSTLPIDVQVFHCKARDPHVEDWRVGCHLRRPPRHSTEVPNHTVYERRVRYSAKQSFFFFVTVKVSDNRQHRSSDSFMGGTIFHTYLAIEKYSKKIDRFTTTGRLTVLW